MSTTKPNPGINVDDDFDDLDDVLDQFSPNPIPAPPPTAALAPPLGRPRQNTRVDAVPPSLPGSFGSKLDPTTKTDDNELSKAFAEELSKGMEGLLKELVEEASTDEDGKTSDEEKRTFLKAAWEAMFLESMNSNSDSAAQPSTSNPDKTGADFTARLKNAMDNLKKSESKLQEASGTGAPAPESIEALLKSLDNNENPEEELGNLLENMMHRLLCKEVLQEPLKELSDRFPGYLAKPPSPLSEEDKQRYLKQQTCVSKILEVFDKPDYRDDHPEYSRQTLELMSEMQSYGSPPSEIMGDLPPGFDTFDKLDGDCLIS